VKDLGDYATTTMWSMDFVRALLRLPWYRRIIFRITVGKYTYREFIGMANSMRNEIHYEYDLEHMDYHNEILRMDFKMELQNETHTKS
jgi:hypothetical protein